MNAPATILKAPAATTAEVRVALRERFCQPEFALFEEVGDSGSQSGVYADAVAINMWASRGYAITGFEVKVSRSDWLRELKQPEKAEPVLTKCDYWYLVAPDEVYVPDEVPPSWGIMSFKDGKLREKRKPPKLEPKPITRAFVAQMFRRAHVLEQRDITALVAKARADDRAAIEKKIDERVKQETRRLETEAYKWQRVKDAVGEEWLEDGRLIEAVKAVNAAGITGTYSGLNELLQKLKWASEAIEKAGAPFSLTQNHSEP